MKKIILIILPCILTTTITFSMENNNLEKMTKEDLKRFQFLPFVYHHLNSDDNFRRSFSRDIEQMEKIHLQSKKNKMSTNNDTQQIVDECPICFEDINDIKNVTLQCTHRFHVDCIDEWKKMKSECPLCGGQIMFPDVSAVTKKTENSSVFAIVNDIPGWY